MTLIEVVDAARDMLKEKLSSGRSFPDNSSSFIEDREMIVWYNLAQNEIQQKLIQTDENWFVTSTGITVVPGTEEYAMPCACLKVVRMENIDNCSSPYALTPITINDKDDIYTTRIDLTSAGEPNSYVIKGNRFILRPIPGVGASLRVYYHRRADWINTASTCSVLPDEYHELLVLGIVERGAMKKEYNAESLGAILNKKRELSDLLMRTGENRQIQKSRMVRRRRHGL